MQLTKKAGLMAIFLSLVTLCGIAGAETVTIGTLTDAAGTVVVDSNDQPTGDYTFSGAFHFDTSTLYGGLTIAQIMGDVGQYTFAANSAGTVPAYDSDGGVGPIFRGNFQWVLNNTTGTQNATLYGSVVNFAFSPTGQNTGTLTGTVQSSDGNVHWYSGYDIDPGGMTPLADFNISDIFNVTGDYTVIGWDPVTRTATYSFTDGVVTATMVPLPPSVWLLGSGLLGLGLLRRRKFFNP